MNPALFTVAFSTAIYMLTGSALLPNTDKPNLKLATNNFQTQDQESEQHNNKVLYALNASSLNRLFITTNASKLIISKTNSAKIEILTKQPIPSNKEPVFTQENEVATFFYKNSSNKQDTTVNIYLTKIDFLSIENESGDINIAALGGELQIENTDGKVVINQWAGPIKVANINGQINLNKGEGELKIISKGGEINITDYQYPFADIQTVSGNITTHKTFGQSNIITKTGVITSFQHPDSIRITTESGDVNFDFSPGNRGPISISSKNGNIHLSPFDKAEGVFNIRAENGKILGIKNYNTEQPLKLSDKKWHSEISTDQGTIKVSP